MEVPGIFMSCGQWWVVSGWALEEREITTTPGMPGMLLAVTLLTTYYAGQCA